MRRELLVIVSIVFGLLFFASCKSTESQNKRGRMGEHERPTAAELLKKMDVNEDNKLSKNEVKGPLSTDFDKIDTNEDGFLSIQELENAPEPNKNKKMTLRRDTDF